MTDPIIERCRTPPGWLLGSAVNGTRTEPIRSLWNLIQRSCHSSRWMNISPLSASNRLSSANRPMSFMGKDTKIGCLLYNSRKFSLRDEASPNRLRLTGFKIWLSIVVNSSTKDTWSYWTARPGECTSGKIFEKPREKSVGTLNIFVDFKAAFGNTLPQCRYIRIRNPLKTCTRMSMLIYPR